MDKPVFQPLLAFLERIPAISAPIWKGEHKKGLWWVKFRIDINHPLAWHTVQELGSVVNYLSINDRLPTVFYPVSPPPYLNGGPASFLSWVIENEDPAFGPEILQEWLEDRLPNPVDDLSQWEEE
ncbi:MAG: hypothetical protein AAGH79_04315 [Bacteroidota bacterium]